MLLTLVSVIPDFVKPWQGLNSPFLTPLHAGFIGLPMAEESAEVHCYLLNSDRIHKDAQHCRCRPACPHLPQGEPGAQFPFLPLSNHRPPSVPPSPSVGAFFILLLPTPSLPWFPRRFAYSCVKLLSI